ncbi:zinc finger HIT domain-containing protein 2 isoform X2 [Macrobrachium rosenbergii]|uniref:zinc finger HIT domain-containing protein 2 isoform X2 n=1 Tax=Macrobrachium rosenbergii TaxID=79674 RepID=UPI0034D47E72
MATSSAVEKCSFCANNAKYTCPRCNSQYCSSACYRNEAHAQCSENFYKEQVKAELEGSHLPKESRKKMEEILKRVESDGSVISDGNEVLDSDDDEDEVDLAERMAGVDLSDSNTVWKLLSDEEREEFRELVNSGNFENLIPTFDPWWEQEVPLVQEVRDQKNSTPEYHSNCPPLTEVPKFSELTKTPPSSCIPFNILNVLTSYAWMVRLFNGDHEESSLDATEALLTLSTVLSTNANFEEAAIAVESPRMEAQHHSWLMESEEFAVTVKNDVKKILQGPCKSDQMFYINAAFSDMHAVLNTSKASLSKKKKSTEGARERKGLFASAFAEANQHVNLKLTTLQTVKLSIKKIEFFLSYCKEYSSVICSLVPS